MDRDEFFEELILSGAVEFAGIDSETGEMLYNFSKNLENLNPTLYASFLKDIEAQIYLFWEKGFLSMNITESNPTVSLTEKALDQFAIDRELDPEQRRGLEFLKQFMSK